MDEPCVIQADYVNWRPVPSRKTLQLVFEVDISLQNEVLGYLGAPASDKSIPCAIALLDLNKPVGVVDPRDFSGFTDIMRGSTSSEAQPNGSPKKSWAEYKASQQAAILCDDVEFQRYFSCLSPETANLSLKKQLRIASKKELDTDPEAAARFSEVVALYHLHRQRHGSPLRGAKNVS